jgi:hypothetical protein
LTIYLKILSPFELERTTAKIYKDRFVTFFR